MSHVTHTYGQEAKISPTLSTYMLAVPCSYRVPLPPFSTRQFFLSLCEFFLPLLELFDTSVNYFCPSVNYMIPP